MKRLRLAAALGVLLLGLPSLASGQTGAARFVVFEGFYNPG
jgi:hypothetical protein